MDNDDVLRWAIAGDLTNAPWPSKVELALVIRKLHAELEDRRTARLCADCALEDNLASPQALVSKLADASAQMREAVENLEIAIGRRRRA